MVRKILRFYYFTRFLLGAAHSFFFATYTLFLLAAGLNLLEVNSVNCFYMFSVALFEVPTGMFADRFGRKASVVVSFLVYSMSMLLYYASSNFAMFVIAEIIGALAHTFYSGAFDAWMVDSAKVINQNFDSDPALANGEVYENVGCMVGVALGAQCGQNNLSLPWLMSSAGMALLSIWVMCVMKEDRYYRESGKIKKGKTLTVRLNAEWQGIKKDFSYIFAYRPLLYIVIAGVLFSFSCMAPNMFWPVVFRNLDVSIAGLGFLHFGSIAIIMLGNIFVKKFKNHIKKEKHAIIVALSIFSFGLLLAVKDGTIAVTLAGFYIHELARGMYKPLYKQYINSRLEARFRATMLSHASMYSSIGALLGLWLSGFLAKNFSISLSWLVSALVLMVFLPFLYSMKNGE